jgi:hypothetical protein
MNDWHESASYSGHANVGYVGGIGLSALILPEWQHSEDWD